MSCILIVGSTGTGKSSSLRNLPLDKTLYVNCENKDIPFKHAKLNKEIRPNTAYEVLAGVKAIDTMKDIDYVIIDSISMLMDTFYLDNIKNAEDSRSGWGEYKDFLKELIDRSKKSDKHFIFTGLIKEMYDSNDFVNKKYCSVQGSYFQKVESEFTVVLETVVMNENNALEYRYCTNKTAENVGTPAKSPMDCLPLYLGNDVVEVFKLIEEYNKG